MNDTTRNVDKGGLAHFEGMASRWWDTSGEFRSLHDINPLRLDFVAARAQLAHKNVLDVGCGGGILCEALAHREARVTGIDAGTSTLSVARLHRLESGLPIDYRHATAEELAVREPAAWDVVTCMELLEHVPDPASLVAACARLVRPGGDVFFSTINRTPQAWLLAVVGAEYVLGLLPKGTHEYVKLVRPSELDTWCRAAGLELRELRGMRYNPLTRRCGLSTDVSVNYLAWLRRIAPDAAEELP